MTRKERRKFEREQQTVVSPPSFSEGSKTTELIVLFVTVIVIVAGILFFLWYVGTPKMGESFEDQGTAHVAEDAAREPYNSNPPTSGPHASQPLDWGVYQEEQRDDQIIHNLEHGGIWISYKNISSTAKKELEKIARNYPGRVVLSPRSKNDDKIAVASWRRLMRLDKINTEKIIEFIEKNTNKSPERIAR